MREGQARWTHAGVGGFTHRIELQNHMFKSICVDQVLWSTLRFGLNRAPSYIIHVVPRDSCILRVNDPVPVQLSHDFIHLMMKSSSNISPLFHRLIVVECIGTITLQKSHVMLRCIVGFCPMIPCTIESNSQCCWCSDSARTRLTCQRSRGPRRGHHNRPGWDSQTGSLLTQMPASKWHLLRPQG